MCIVHRYIYEVKHSTKTLCVGALFSVFTHLNAIVNVIILNSVTVIIHRTRQMPLE